MRNLTLAVMSLACGLLLGGVLYLRLHDTGGPVRLVILALSLVMAVVMVRLAARAGTSPR